MRKIFKKGNIKIDSELLDFINNEVIPGTNVDPDYFGQNLIKHYMN